MSKVMEKVKEEFLAVLPPTIYFFIALHIVGLVRSLMTRGTGLPPFSTTSILVAALILGKSVLIADMLPFIYLLVSAVIHYLERLYDFSREAGGIVAGNEKLLAEIVWPHFWAVQLLLLVLIATYCTMHELARLIGKDRMLRIFFGPMPLPQVGTPS